MIANNYKFRGGALMGYYSNTWPFVVLDVSRDFLVIRDKLLHKEIRLSKSDIDRIEIKKYIPIVGYGIGIYHRNKLYTNLLIFWYVSFNFDKLLSSLKELDWL